MKSNYEDQMFEFLTDEDRFRNMSLLVEQYEPVRRRLITEFWDDVFKLIEVWAKEKEEAGGTKWIITKTDCFYQYSNISVSKSDWDGTADKAEVNLTWTGLHNNPSYGVWTHYNSKIFKVWEFCEALHKLELNKSFPQRDHHWWPLKSPSDLKLDQWQSLIRILPHHRSEMAKTFADTLTSFAEEIEEHIDGIYKECLV